MEWIKRIFSLILSFVYNWSILSLTVGYWNAFQTHQNKTVLLVMTHCFCQLWKMKWNLSSSNMWCVIVAFLFKSDEDDEDANRLLRIDLNYPEIEFHFVLDEPGNLSGIFLLNTTKNIVIYWKRIQISHGWVTPHILNHYWQERLYQLWRWIGGTIPYLPNSQGISQPYWNQRILTNWTPFCMMTKMMPPSSINLVWCKPIWVKLHLEVMMHMSTRENLL